MKTFLHLWYYLTELFLEWEIFQIKVVEKIKTRILYSGTSPPPFPPTENRAVYEIMSKTFGGAREAADNMAHARCLLDK